MMKKLMTTSFHFSPLILGLLFVFQSACAAPPQTLEGIHIHLEGTMPFVADAAARQLKASKAQCESPQIKEMCAMPHVAADKTAGSGLCAAVAGGFKLKGSLADVGKTKTDVYFWPAKKMSARYGKGYVLKAKQLCEFEVVEEKNVKLIHYAPGGGGVRYELQDHPNKGVYWRLSKSPKLGPGIFTALKGRVPFADPSEISAVLGHDLIAGHKCEIREYSGPWTFTLCQKKTGSNFAETVTLAAKVVAGKDVMLDERATAVAMNVVLPASLFFPPVGEKVETVGAKSADNPTQKWCAKQQAKTGVNPCEDGSDDGEQ